LKNIKELQLNLNKKERKNLYLYLTHNQENLIKIKFNDTNIIQKKILNSNIGNEILSNFSDIPKYKYNEIKKNIVDDFFSIIEKRTNEFIVYKILEDLKYDLNNFIYIINLDKKNKSIRPINTFLFCDLNDYESANEFLVSNYEDKLKPIEHNKKELTVYCLKQHYIEEFDNFIYDILNKVVVHNIKKETIDLYVDNFNLFDTKEGLIILKYFFTKFSHVYLDHIFSFSIYELFNLFNIPEHKKTLKLVKEKADTQNHKLLRLKNGIYKLLYCFKNKYNDFYIKINNKVFFSEDEIFLEYVLKEINSLLINKKEIIFLFIKDTNINNTTFISGFTYENINGISFIEKESNYLFNRHDSNNNILIKNFDFKTEVNFIFN
jgi:hypothetical protein